MSLPPAKVWPKRLLNPPITCPECGEPVIGHVNQTEPTDFRVQPCQCCNIDPLWLDAFYDEMQCRYRGEPPNDVDAVWKEKRRKKMGDLQDKLREQYRKHEAAVFAGALEARILAEKEIVKLTTRVAVIDPKAVPLLQPVELDPEVRKWARQLFFTMPPAPRSQAPLTITLSQLIDALGEDGEYQEAPVPRRSQIAQAILHELKDFAERQKPVSQISYRIIMAVAPDAAEWLACRLDSELADANDPTAHPADVFNQRRKRRTDVINDTLKPPPDTDDPLAPIDE